MITMQLRHTVGTLPVPLAPFQHIIQYSGALHTLLACGLAALPAGSKFQYKASGALILAGRFAPAPPTRGTQPVPLEPLRHIIQYKEERARVMPPSSSGRWLCSAAVGLAEGMRAG
jgi:hypothetical protein